MRFREELGQGGRAASLYGGPDYAYRLAELAPFSISAAKLGHLYEGCIQGGRTAVLSSAH